jgi:hypothetical protein
MPKPSRTLVVFIFTLLIAETARGQAESFERGLRANAELVAFLQNHSCEVGLVPGRSCPLRIGTVRDLKERFRDVATWKRETFRETVPANDWIAGRAVTVTPGPRFTLAEIDRFNPRTLRREPHLLVTLGEDRETRDRVDRAGLAAANYLVLYDNFFRLSELFSRARKLRSILTNDLGPEGKLFFETFRSTLNEESWNRTAALVEFLRGPGPKPRAVARYLEASLTAIALREKNVAFLLQKHLLVRRNLSEAAFYDQLETTLAILSRIFGNAIGSIQFRAGKLKELAGDDDFLRTTREKLRPLDILFERTPFRATDKFIPGHFGHVALWLGSPAELAAMTVSYRGFRIPLLTHPEVVSHRDAIVRGRLIVEALRAPGVTLNPLESFLDVDDLLVLRPPPVRDPGEHVLRALRQLGKPYDFSYDIETEEALICSELVYRVFEEEDWPASWEFGRRTMNPDHVAWKALNDDYEPILFFRDGEELHIDLRGALRSVLEAAGNPLAVAGSVD